MRVLCRAAAKQAYVRELIASLESRLKGRGRLVVRKSDKPGCVRITAEGENKSLLNELTAEAAAAFAQKVA